MYREKVDTLNEKPDLTYITEVVKDPWFDGLDDDFFDENNLKKTWDRDRELKLISEHILDNENAVLTIVARDTKQVNDVLRTNYASSFRDEPKMKTEPITEVTYYVHETDLFENATNVVKDFTREKYHLSPDMGSGLYIAFCAATGE